MKHMPFFMQQADDLANHLQNLLAMHNFSRLTILIGHDLSLYQANTRSHSFLGIPVQWDINFAKDGAFIALLPFRTPSTITRLKSTMLEYFFSSRHVVWIVPQHFSSRS